MRMLALVVVLAGCPSKGPVDTAQTAAGPKPCEKMADHLVSLMNPKDADGGSNEKPTDAMRETVDAITRVFIERCTKDKWTMDAQQCFLGLTKLEDSNKCAPLLTVAQRDAADQAMEAALGPRATGSDTPPPPADAGSGAPPSP